MGKTKVTAIVDSNEPGDVFGVVKSHEDVSQCTVDPLDVGDIVVGSVAVFERKTPEDWAASVMGEQRNVYDQAKRMANSSYDQAFILIEGDIRSFEELEHTSIPPKALRGAVASVTMRTGVPVVFVGDLFMLVDMAVRYGRKCIEEPGSTFVKSGAVTDEEHPLTVRLYATLPGVGPERAKTLQTMYPSVRHLCDADVEDIAELPRFGEETAAKVIRAVNGQMG